VNPSKVYHEISKAGGRRPWESSDDNDSVLLVYCVAVCCSVLHCVAVY